MNHHRSSRRHDSDEMLFDRIRCASRRLHEKLCALNLTSLGISEYNRRQLQRHVFQARARLDAYGYLLYLCFSGDPLAFQRSVFVDYGGGSGLLSFLATEIGTGTVIYNDIYDVSCNDVLRISRSLQLPLRHVVCGDINDLVSYVRGASTPVTAIASYDVIEHIYDIERHLRTLPLLSTLPFRVAHASGANTKNPFIARALIRHQRQVELKNRETRPGWKERDTLRAYLQLRKEIIANHAPELSRAEVEDLASLTRGLRKDDIEQRVDEYRRRGRIAYRPDHPTNTCDPYTGNWCERLMKLEWLEGILREAGFSTKVFCGSWTSSSRSLVKQIPLRLANAAIRLLGRWASPIAPYYVLYATHSGTGKALP